jgi:SAM-dependent methyltransferase
LPRHRFLWLHVTSSGLLARPNDVLHVAPEAAIATRLRTAAANYTSADIEPGRAMVAADLTALPFPDRSFDLVVCSHVLEHVPDDRAAMRELFRVLRPAGVALIQTPVNYDQAETYEDPGETDAGERMRRFSQADHLRVFGRDLLDRLVAAGFEVNVEAAGDLGVGANTRHRLSAGSAPLRNDIYRCLRPGRQLSAGSVG